jgi:hypothetical protein
LVDQKFARAALTPLAYRKRTAAPLLGMGLTKLDEKIALGEIEALRDGKNVIITHSELLRYLASLPKAQLAVPLRLASTLPAAKAAPAADARRARADHRQGDSPGNGDPPAPPPGDDGDVADDAGGNE